MFRSSQYVIVALFALAAGAAAAQNSEAQGMQVDREGPRVELQAEQGGQTQEIDVQLREAEERLADAAARVAELSRRRLPETYAVERHLSFARRPMLGVTIGAGGDARGSVEGVTIRGVTPGSAAAEAGLRSGDIITAINDESLSADSDEHANRKLLDFLEGIEDDDVLGLEYLRDGKSASVDVKPRAMANQFFAVGPDAGGFVTRALPAPMAPGAPPNVFSFFVGGGAWGDMEMVSLTGDLGRYFGTDKGLLVVRAPKDGALKLRDGDVIQSIDGREPTSVSHAMRILGSYQSGETLKIGIMRDRKSQTLAVEVPDNRSSFAPRLQRFAPRDHADEAVVIDPGDNVAGERT